MKIRTKTIALISAIGFLIFLALHMISVFVILPSFENIENHENQESVTEVIKAIQYSLSELDSRVKDWSIWDDTYIFAQTQNTDYIENNLMDDVFVNLKLNLFLIIAPEGSITYGKAFDLKNTVEIPVTSEIKTTIESNPNLWSFSAPDQHTSGIINLSGQPFLVASEPIVTSTGEGPIAGALLFGVTADIIRTDYLSRTTAITLTVHRFDDLEIQNNPELVATLLSGKKTTYSQVSSPNTISGYALLRDINANPAIVVQVDQDREIYQQGQNVMILFLVASLVFSIGFGLVVMLVLEKNVILPLNKLTGAVKKNSTVFSPEDFAKFKTDEISILATAVKDAMTQKLETISEMGAMIGHDLRNPLTGIKSANYYLKTKYSTHLDDKGKEMLKTIDDCVEFSNKIVNDLLEYSREIRLKPAKTNPKKLLDQALSIVKVPKNIQLENTTKESHGIEADEGKLGRVFNNLIHNAFDAMPKGGKLSIDSKKKNGGVEIIFEDTGVGMTEETLKKIWIPFFTTKAKGMGFGLPICKRIIEAHGGRIDVKSVLDKGTVFTVYLPTVKS